MFSLKVLSHLSLLKSQRISQLHKLARPSINYKMTNQITVACITLRYKENISEPNQKCFGSDGISFKTSCLNTCSILQLQRYLDSHPNLTIFQYIFYNKNVRSYPYLSVLAFVCCLFLQKIVGKCRKIVSKINAKQHPAILTFSF